MRDADEAPHGASLRTGRTSMTGCPYFITKGLLSRNERLLSDPQCAEIVADSLVWMQNNGLWSLLAFVVMPDHFHVVLRLSGDRSLPQTMHSVDRFTAKRINEHLGRLGSIWQNGFYDHAIRDLESLRAAIDYVNHNPVTAGLVDSPELWTYSSMNPRYESVVETAWDSIAR